MGPFRWPRSRVDNAIALSKEIIVRRLAKADDCRISFKSLFFFVRYFGFQKVFLLHGRLAEYSVLYLIYRNAKWFTVLLSRTCISFASGLQLPNRKTKYFLGKWFVDENRYQLLTVCLPNYDLLYSEILNHGDEHRWSHNYFSDVHLNAVVSFNFLLFYLKRYRGFTTKLII